MPDELTPVTNIEKFLAKTAGEAVDLPEPVTRIEKYLNKISSEQSIISATENWLDEHIDPDTGYALDTTLTLANAAAPAKTVGDALASQSEKIEDVENTVISEKTIPTYNLLDISTITEGYYVQSSGELSDNSSYNASDYIPIKPSTTYTFQCLDSGLGLKAEDRTTKKFYQIACYDSGKNNISSAYRTYADSYTTPQNGAYIRFSMNYYLQASQNPAVVEGTTVLDYISYQPNKTKPVINEDLLSEYFDFNLVNRLNPSECTIGYEINASGIITENSTYFITDYIPINAGETLYFFDRIIGEKKPIRRFAAFDSTKTLLSANGSNTQVNEIVQRGAMAFVRCTIYYNANAEWRTPKYTACITTATPEFIPEYNGTIPIDSKFIRKKVMVYATDTESVIIQKMIDAYNIGNCDVYFERANYTFGTELPKISTDYGMKWNEIPIGNNCRYYFNGSILTATIDLSQLTPEPGDDEFYCNFMGCQKEPSSYEMYDGVLNATDTRYVVHDESNGASALKNTFKHLYSNMEMNYTTSLREETIRKCIGGGTGLDGVVEIVGCKFTTDGSEACVSYHGNLDNTDPAKFDINIRNCWFSNKFASGDLLSNQTARLFFTGNSTSGAITIGDGWTVTSFLNEIRT